MMTLIWKGEIDVPLIMRDWAGLSFRKLVSENGDRAVVRLLDAGSGEVFEVEIVRFNGLWQIDTMVPVLVDGPRVAMEEIFRAAKERDKAALKARSSRSLIAIADDDGKLPRAFNELDHLSFLSAKRVDDAAADVVVETTDGTNRRFTFRMILEGGKWKLTEHGR